MTPSSDSSRSGSSWQPKWAMQSIYDTDVPGMIERGARALAARAGDENVFEGTKDADIAGSYREDAEAVLRAAFEGDDFR